MPSADEKSHSVPLGLITPRKEPRVQLPYPLRGFLGAPITNFDRLTLFTRDISLDAQQSSSAQCTIKNECTFFTRPFQIVRLLFFPSSSTPASLSKICDFWKQLSWPDVASSYPFVYSMYSSFVYISSFMASALLTNSTPSVHHIA